MKANHKIAAIVVGSFVLALGAASVLQAQAKPPAYVFAEINVKDQDGYTKDYLPKDEQGSRRRPDFVMLPDGSAGFYSRDSYDLGGDVHGVAKLVIAEIAERYHWPRRISRGNTWRS
jgi:hypothetical protein